jgi:hypothetical protein
LRLSSLPADRLAATIRFVARLHGKMHYLRLSPRR